MAVVAEASFRLEDFDRLPDTAVIRVSKVAQVMSVSESTIWRLDRVGALKSIKLTQRLRGWRVGDIRAYLAGA